MNTTLYLTRDMVWSAVIQAQGLLDYLDRPYGYEDLANQVVARLFGPGHSQSNPPAEPVQFQQETDK